MRENRYSRLVHRLLSALLLCLAAALSCGAPAKKSARSAIPVPPPPVLWDNQTESWIAPPDAVCPDAPLRLAAVERSICHPESCGNGRIEPTCAFPPDSMGAEPRHVSETCDGADLGQATCESLGYAGGSLRCHPDCVFDTRECNACVPSPHVAACARADVSMAGAPPSFALAASESEVALAWVSGAVDAQVPEAGRAHAVHFARFRPDLTKIMETDCAGPTALGAARTPNAIGLVARPGGWLLALQFEGGVALQWIEPSGEPSTIRPRVLRGRLVRLVERPGGEPLLLYEPGYPHLGTAGVVLDAMGTALRGPVWVTDGTSADGAWTGDGFFVVAMEHTATNPISAVLLDADLKILGRGTIAPGMTYPPRIGWVGHEAWLTYATRDYEPRLLRLASDGAPLGPVIDLTAPRDAASGLLGAAASFSVDLKILGTIHFARMKGSDRLQMVPGPLSTVMRGPGEKELGAIQIARLGESTVVAWVTTRYPGRIDLARIAP